MKIFRFLLIAALAAAAATASAHYAERISGTAKKALDGDDFIFAPDNGEEPFRVRLCGVDAPALTEDHGPHARAALEMMMAGKKLNLDVIPKMPPIKLYEKDGEHFSPERDLAVVHIVGEQVPINLLLVADGHARHMYMASSFCGEYLPSARLDKAESGARGAARGLWAF